jgi:hypothetical protein
MGKNRNTVILLGVILLLLAVSYPYLTSNKVPEELGAPVGSEERSVILQQVNSIKFDMSIVQNKMLSSLRNQTLPSLGIPPGKSVPFANTGI